MTSDSSSCYYCNNTKTSKEHVPAKIFFPDEKYSRTGVNQRNELITVPSCDVHNTEKGHLDEYLFIVITMNIMANSDGVHMGLTKMMKMVERHKRVARELLGSATPLLMKNISTGEVSHSAGINTNPIKLQSCFDHISRAIYFHHFKNRFNGNTKFHAEFLVFLDEDSISKNNQLQKVRDFTKQTFGTIEKFGKNPEIFYYQIIDSNTNEEVLIHLCFYEQAKVSVLMTSI